VARPRPIPVCPSALAAALIGVGVGCASAGSIPEPAPAVEAYARAVEAGDADAVYALMSQESRRALSLGELRDILAQQRVELGAHAKALRNPDRALRTRAQLRYPDGELVSLDWVEGEFRVAAADALPAAARTPAQALGQLRRVLARRSYAGLLRVLTPRTRSSLEGDLRSLVDGLNTPEALPIDVVGDKASVLVPGGHRVELRREDGVWQVDDFD
jgi:hypothetical protein